jgi:hypothetical protein
MNLDTAQSAQLHHYITCIISRYSSHGKSKSSRTLWRNDADDVVMQLPVSGLGRALS